MESDCILVVDDNPANLKLARLVLSVSGYKVITAADAEQARSLLVSDKPRLILMDIQLPDMDGLELTRIIKADPLTRDTIVVAVTAYAMKGDEERARAAGCDGYLTKPINTRTLGASVASFLERAL